MPTTKSPLVVLSNLSKVNFPDGAVEVFKDISLSVHRGSMVALMGEIDTGKSVLLRVLAGLLESDGEKELPCDTIGYMAQRFAQIDTAAIEENIRAQQQAGNSAATISISQENYVSSFQLWQKNMATELKTVAPQLATLKLALGSGAELLLLDEPFSEIAGVAKLKARRACWEFVRNKPASIIMATHDIEEVAEFCDKVLYLSGSPSRLHRSPNFSQTPSTERLGKMQSFLEAIEDK